MNNIAVFCGSRLGNSEEIRTQIIKLVSLFADSNCNLVYGGSKKGIMGIVARVFVQHNRKIIGILPYRKLENEKISNDLTSRICVNNLFERKMKMIELSNVFLILPGGVGTLDEMLEIIVSNRMKFTSKKVAIFNVQKYYEYFILQLNKMIELGFLNSNIWDEIIIEESAEELFLKLTLI